jgi:ATP-dependent DNA helicase DinG
MRQRATDADVIVVNHHLFFADLALRNGAYGAVLPDYAAVILDEAHQIEDVASEYFRPPGFRIIKSMICCGMSAT